MSGQFSRAPVGPGQESVWDYPPVGKLVTENRQIRIYLAGIPIVQTKNAVKVVQYGHAPMVYIPGQDFRHCELRRLKHTFPDDQKGTATEFTIIAGGHISHRSAWTHFNALGPYRRLMGFYAVHPGRVERACIGDLDVTPQPGGYPGWVTPDVVGPFIGDPVVSGPSA